jgi:hypothetical protein
LDKVEEAINALREYGSQRQAAIALGVSRSTLQDRLKKADHGAMEAAAESLGFPSEEVKSYWIKTENGSYYVKRDTEVSYNDLRQGFLDFAASHSPIVKKRTFAKAEHLLVIDPADIHFNKLALTAETGKEYNLDIAESRLLNGVQKLLSKADVFGIDRIVFVLGNDFLHSDNPFSTTTSGTRQDTATMWWDAYNRAKKAFVQAIELCTHYAPVHLVHCPSNHDYASGWMLSDSIGSWFRNDANVILSDSSLSIAHRKYIQYGNNLLGFTHNDGAKEGDLANLMQLECRKAWSESRFATWFLHHYHIKDRKSYGKNPVKIERDNLGVTVIRSSAIDPENNVFTEIVRSPSGTDSWHHRNGYVGKQAIEAFMHHVEDGPSVRFTEWF